MIRDLLAHRVVVHFKNHLGTAKHQLAAVRPHDPALFSDGPLHKQTADTGGGIIRSGGSVRGLGLLKPCERMVRHLAAFYRGWTNFNRAYPSRLREACRHYRLVPRIE